MSELANALEELAGRGNAAGAKTVVQAALDEAGVPTPRRAPRLLFAMAAALAVTLAVAAVVVTRVNNHIERVNADDALTTPASSTVLNVLVVGVDTRDDMPNVAPRADTIMLMRINQATGAAAALGLPRDLAVGEERLSALRAKGAGALIDGVRTLTGQPVDHYVEVDFKGFAAVVDAIGGVRIPVAAPVRDQLSGLSLDTGCVTLDGDTALAYVRSRHLESFEDGRWVVDPTGDIGRIQRQQALVVRAIGKLRGAVSHPADLNRLVNKVFDNLTIDDNLSTRGLVRFARSVARSDQSMRMLLMPFTTAQLNNGGMVLRVDDTQLPDVISQFTSDEPQTTPTKTKADCS